MSNKTVTRAHLTDIVYREIGLSHAESADLVDSVFEEVTKALEGEDTVKLSSFGTFSVRHKKERIGRNPKTKEEVPISARKVVTFHASNILTDKVNGIEPSAAAQAEEDKEMDSGSSFSEQQSSTPSFGESDVASGNTDENEDNNW